MDLHEGLFVQIGRKSEGEARLLLRDARGARTTTGPSKFGACLIGIN